MVDPSAFLAGYSGMFTNIVYILELTLLAVGGIFVIWYVFYLKKFDVAVEIRSMRTDAFGHKIWKVLQDKGGWLKDRKSGAIVFRLFKQKKNFEPPPYDFLEPASMGPFIKNKVYAVQTDDDKLHWIRPNYVDFEACPECKGTGIKPVTGGTCEKCNGKKEIPKGISYKISEKDVEFWACNEMQSDLQTFGKPKWWEPLLLPIAGIVIFFMAIVVIWLLLDKIGGVSAVCSSAQQACASMAKSCASPPPAPAPSPPGW